MPRASRSTSLSRQWELMKLLPSRGPGKTARELQDALTSAGYEVTRRTVERDLSELAGLFPLNCNDTSKPYGWHWNRDAQLEIPGMDLAEAVSLGLLEDTLRQLVPPCFYGSLSGRFAEARGKLANLAGISPARWSGLARYVPPGVPFLPPDIPPALLREVQEALLEQRQLLVEYVSIGEEEVKELRLHPLAMVQQGVRTYLVAAAFDYDDPFYYALQRMESAVAQPEPARRPKGFSLDDHLNRGGGQFGSGEFLTLKAQIGSPLAVVLAETPLSTDQRIVERGGKTYLTATVVDSWQLRYWILSQGPDIVVREPRGLRREIADRVREMGEAYGV